MATLTSVSPILRRGSEQFAYCPSLERVTMTKYTDLREFAEMDFNARSALRRLQDQYRRFRVNNLAISQTEFRRIGFHIEKPGVAADEIGMNSAGDAFTPEELIEVSKEYAAKQEPSYVDWDQLS